jgi:hypothetical protein
MKNFSRRTLALGVLLLGASASFAAAAVALPCADYVTTSIDDEPGAGFLIGTEVRSRRAEYTTLVGPGGVGFSIVGGETTTYEVGTYDFGGYRIEIDCSDYSRA